MDKSNSKKQEPVKQVEVKVDDIKLAGAWKANSVVDKYLKPRSGL